MSNKVDLSLYNNRWYNPGKNAMVRVLWYVVNATLFKSYLLPISSLKVIILKLFGAKMGKNITIKPCVNIKYPWFLTVGNHVWIGEEVWIDNLTRVIIGDNCCLSQGVMLLTGNHNYKKTAFDLMVKPIILEEGVWLGAKSTVCPGVICYSHSVLTVNSVAASNLSPYQIYQGNPAQPIKNRLIEES